MKKTLAVVSCFLLLSFLVQAQSIYSFQGLGSLNHQGMPNNVAMGEVGIGTPSVWHINTQNPANLVYNNFSTFQLGSEVESRRFSGENISGSDASGGLRFLSYALPIISGKWSTSFGVLPYSSVGYDTFTESPIEGAPNNARQLIDRQGEGGLTNFFWSNGVQLAKNLSVGVKASLTFGAILDERDILVLEEREITVDDEIEVIEVPVGVVTNLDLKKSYSDVNFQFGLGYRHKLREETFLNFGLTLSPQSEYKEDVKFQDTVETDFTNNKKFPTALGFGMSYQRWERVTVGFDVEFQEWSGVDTEDTPFNDFTKIALGATWIPDFDNVSSYFKRVRYSVGLNRTQLPYIVNNQALTDFGINFGASLPVSGFSSVDLAFKWGQLGETENGSVKENYFKVVLGATINDRWFVKRKYD